VSQPHPPSSGSLAGPSILDALTEGVLLIDREQRVAWINRPLERLLGIDRDPIHGSNAGEFVRRHLGPCIIDRACADRVAASLSMSQSSIEVTCTFRSPGGRVIISDVILQDEPFRGMRLVRFQGIARQKQAEDAFRESDETYRQIFASMGVGFAFYEMVRDSAGRPVDYLILDIDPAYEHIMGAHRDRIVGQRFTEIYPGIEPLWIERYDKVLRTQKPARFEEYNPKSGRWYDIDAYPMREDDRFAVIFTEITGWKQAEEALQESEERYRTLFESASDALFIHDRNGKILDVNRAAVERLGYSREELLAICLTDIVLPEFAALVPDQTRAVVERGRMIFETAHLARDGRRIPVETSSQVIPYRKGTAILAVSRDITRRKRSEEVLRHQAEMFERLIDTIPVMIVIFDPELRQFRFNRAFRETLGWTEEDIAGRDLMTVVYPDPDYRAKAAAFMQSLEPGWREWKVTAKDGSIVESSWANISLADTTRIGIGIDLRERKRAEEALRASEKRFRLLSENASDIVLVFDEQGIISYASPSVRPIGGYAPEDLIGKCIFEFVHPDDLPPARDALQRAAAHPGRQVTLEVRVRHSGEDWLYLDLTVNNLLDESAIRGYVVNARDITRRKLAEEEVLQSERSLAAELDAARHLQQVSTQLIQADRVEALYEQILDTAVTILAADFASIQMLDVNRGPMGELQLLGHRGFTEEAARFWEWVCPGSESACGKALSTRQRVIIPDIRDCEFLAGSADRDILMQTGIRAVQTTPLYSRSGTLLGMLSTHWRRPHEPTASELRAIDLLARQAADLIDRRRAEDALQCRTEDLIRKSEELEAARDTANIYLDILTHDVRNANNVSGMYADLLVGMTEGDLKTYAEKLHASIGRSTEILQNVATIRRAQEEAGLVPVNLDAVIREEIATFRGATIRYAGHEVNVRADGLLPTVFTNLIGNAIKHGGPGVVVTVRVEERDGEVLVSVEDTGQGVPDAVKKRLFTRFERGMARGSGQGLGLFIVRTLVARYGGRVSIEDRVPGHPEEGAAFRFTLKRVAQDG